MQEMIASIRALPDELYSAVDGLTDAQLDTPYREGGWTVRQVVHHLADSHMNAFVRMKLILTEDHPTLKPYDQDLWAMQPDARGSIDSSLQIIKGLHDRMAILLEQANKADFTRTAHHPENGEMTLTDLLRIYSSHGANHVKQITDLRARMGW
jgi:uncharacterized damage-inducible protein DinB